MMGVPALVGLSPKHFEEEADLFIEHMRKEGAIDQAVFSMLIGTENE